MKIAATVCSLKFPVVILGFVFAGNACAADLDATRQLKSRNAEFTKDIVKVSESVYTAVGYGVSPVSMVIGSEGLVIIDTGIDVESGQEIREDFRRLTTKPVKAIVFTHGHPDHTRGAAAFMDTPDVQIWARAGFGHEHRTLEEAGITVQKQRGARQAGFALTAEQRINNGIAKAYWPSKKGGIFSGAEELTPTHLVAGNREKLSLAGVDLELVAASGETQDHLYVWFARERVAFSGDNFYKSWPNLYAIRGTPYRDIREWATAIDRILEERPAAVVGGHTRPIVGEAAVNEMLGNYRDAIRWLFDKTVEGINKGMTPNQLVEYVSLPEKYRVLDYLQPYYGNPEWAVRAIFGGYLGWFDGNASSLFPLSDRVEADRIIKLAGGLDELLSSIDSALAEGDYQWAAQLCDYILAMQPDHTIALTHKADALTALADDVLTATARNYYLSSAIELRRRAAGE